MEIWGADSVVAFVWPPTSPFSSTVLAVASSGAFNSASAGVGVVVGTAVGAGNGAGVRATSLSTTVSWVVTFLSGVSGAGDATSCTTPVTAGLLATSVITASLLLLRAGFASAVLSGAAPSNVTVGVARCLIGSGSSALGFPGMAGPSVGAVTANVGET